MQMSRNSWDDQEQSQGLDKSYRLHPADGPQRAEQSKQLRQARLSAMPEKPYRRSLSATESAKSQIWLISLLLLLTVSCYNADLLGCHINDAYPSRPIAQPQDPFSVQNPFLRGFKVLSRTKATKCQTRKPQPLKPPIGQIQLNIPHSCKRSGSTANTLFKGFWIVINPLQQR